MTKAMTKRSRSKRAKFYDVVFNEMGAIAKDTIEADVVKISYIGHLELRFKGELVACFAHWNSFAVAIKSDAKT